MNKELEDYIEKIKQALETNPSNITIGEINSGADRVADNIIPSEYADFLHELVTKVQDCTLRFMDELKDKGIKVNDIDEKEMHLLLSAQYSAMLEMLKHDYTYEEGVLHLSINNYSYNDTLFKLDIGIINFNNFINDEENLLLRTRFYREEEDSDE